MTSPRFMVVCSLGFSSWWCYGLCFFSCDPHCCCLCVCGSQWPGLRGYRAALPVGMQFPQAGMCWQHCARSLVTDVVFLLVSAEPPLFTQEDVAQHAQEQGSPWPQVCPEGCLSAFGRPTGATCSGSPAGSSLDQLSWPEHLSPRPPGLSLRASCSAAS